MEAPHEAPCDASSPFRVICPTCGRHSDAEETEFLLVVALPFAGSECLLAGVTCTACGTRVDWAVWPVDPEPITVSLTSAVTCRLSLPGCEGWRYGPSSSGVTKYGPSVTPLSLPLACPIASWPSNCCKSRADQSLKMV